MPQDTITFFAKTNFRNIEKIFGIKKQDRVSHMYIIGRTGTGKSTLVETLCWQDLINEEGFALLDPHGDLAEKVVAHVPQTRKQDLIYFNVPDRSNILAFNPLESVPPDHRPRVVSSILEALKKIWAEAWGVRMEYILRNALYALLDYSEATLADILRLFRDRDFRESVGKKASNPEIQAFWLKDFNNFSWKTRVDGIAPIQNKVGAFLADPLMRQILTQPRSSFQLREIMDSKKVFIVNLAKGKIGEDSAALLGSLLIAKMNSAALSRSDLPEHKRKDFYIYMDEFHTFTTKSLATMLAELRKYGIGLILAHQYLSQIDEDVRDAILANVGTTISFRIGAPDAHLFEKEFFERFGLQELINLPNHDIYLKLMIGGRVSQAFSATTLRVEDL